MINVYISDTHTQISTYFRKKFPCNRLISFMCCLFCRNARKPLKSIGGAPKGSAEHTLETSALRGTVSFQNIIMTPKV